MCGACVRGLFSAQKFGRVATSNMKTERTRLPIVADIYKIIFGEDPRILTETIYRLFRKKKLDQLTNDQLEELIPSLKEAYGRHIEGLSNPKSGTDQRSVPPEHP